MLNYMKDKITSEVLTEIPANTISQNNLCEQMR